MSTQAPGEVRKEPQHSPSQTSRAAAHLPGLARPACTGRGGSGRSSGRAPHRAGSATHTGPRGCSSHRTGLQGQGRAQRAKLSAGSQPPSSPGEQRLWSDSPRPGGQQAPRTPIFDQVLWAVLMPFLPLCLLVVAPKGMSPEFPRARRAVGRVASVGPPWLLSSTTRRGWGTRLAWLSSYHSLARIRLG